jgi:hypothetical protein
MGQPKNIDQAIIDLEKSLFIYKFVKEKIPDAKVHNTQYYHGFSARTVNSNYTNFEFVKGYHTLFVVPFVELEYEYNGLQDYVRVNSSPRSSRLVYISYDRNLKQKVIRFARLKINLKNNNFRDDMLNACRAKILEFIKEHPDCKLDTKHLEPKLKNLLLFT